MIRLVQVELTRLRWRRAVILLVAACIVVPALIAAVTIWDTWPVSDAEIADSAAAARPEITRCEKHPDRFGAGSAEQCEPMITGWYTGREPLDLARQRHGGTGVGTATVLAAFLLLLGTTFVGHDWNTGSMSNQVLFEPRRARVWGAKAIAVTLVSLVVAAVVSTAVWLTLAGVAHLRDIPVGRSELLDCLELGGRGAVFAACAALGGYALTMLLRSTVATLGALLAVSLAGGLLIASLGISQRWQPQVNLQAFVENGSNYYIDPPDACYAGPTPAGLDCSTERHLDLGGAAGYWGVSLLLVGGASVLSFRRRDVP